MKVQELVTERFGKGLFADKNKTTMGVTPEQFFAAWERNKPNVFTYWVYKNFTKEGKTSSIFYRVALISMLAWFFIGFTFTAIDAEKFRPVIGWATFSYAAMLTVVWCMIRYAAFCNQRSIRKVCRELGLTIQQYDKLYEMYGIK